MSRVRRAADEMCRLGIRAIDWVLRRFYRVKPFTDAPDCILRLAPGRSRESILLSDGTRVGVGDPVIELHLWNERLAALPQSRLTLGWGRRLMRGLEASLRLLAAHLEQNPGTRSAVALRGEFGFLMDLRVAEAVATRLGIDIRLKELPGLRIWRRAFWDNVYSYLLLWTFSPASMHGKRLPGLNRAVIWMSLDRLLERYGTREAPAEEALRSEGAGVW